MRLTAGNGAILRPFLVAAGLSLVPGVLAAAEAGGALHAPSQAVFIAQLVVLMLVGRSLGEVMQRVGQPAVVGQLLAGILLGPSVFGALLPSAQAMLFPSNSTQRGMLDAVSQLGILLLLLLTGMETDLRLIRNARRAAFWVSATGVAVPFACGFALGELLPGNILPEGNMRIVSSLFLGTALSISSVKIVAMVVRDMNFMRRNLGQLIVASAIIEDTVGWVILAVILGIAEHGSLDLLSLLKTLTGVGLFLGFSFTIGQRLVFQFIRWTNDTFRSDMPVITAILIVMGLMAMVTDYLGVHAILGAFIAGILVGESPILTRHIDEQLRGLVVALFMPVFFGLSGLKADLSILGSPQLLEITAGFIVIASVGKFSGAFLGGELGGLSFRESIALGCGMNARGSTEVIVATIGLSMGALTASVFTMIVTMAIVTTMMMPPMLRWALSRLPLTSAEKARLNREEMDEKAFIPNLERMIIAVDDSDNGRNASHLAGILAGAHGMPVTIAHIEKARVVPPPTKSDDMTFSSHKLHEIAIKSGAKASVEAIPEAKGAVKPRKVEITHQAQEGSAKDIVIEAARKGFDLLFIGIAHARDEDGAFTREVSRLADSFEGAIALLVPARDVRGGHLEEGARIVLPVNGTEPSRRAAEVAAILSRPTHSEISALFVASPDKAGYKARRRSRRREESLLKDIARLGQRYGVRVDTAIERNDIAEAPILKEASRAGDLIVMGVSRRSGEGLFLGNTATALLKKWPGAILFLAS